MTLFRFPLSIVLTGSLVIGAMAPASTVQVRCDEVFESHLADEILETIEHTSDEVMSRYGSFQQAVRLRWGRNFDPGLNPLPPLRDGDYREAAIRSLKTIYNHPTNFIFGFDALRMRSPVGKVLLRIWDNPSVTLTPAEEKLLNDHGLSEVVQQQREFSQKAPHWRIARKSVDHGLFVVLTAALLLSIEHSIESVEHVLTFEDYIREPSFANGKAVVHLLTETTPFPHSALRIGDRVYYYDIRKIGSSSIPDYLKNQVAGPQQSRQWWKPEIFEGLLSNTLRLSGVERSIRFVEINATPAQIIAMRTELEGRTGQRYFDFPPLTSEDSMMMKFLRRHTGLDLPSVIEVNPNLSQMNLLLNPLALKGQVGRRGLIVPHTRPIAYLVAKSILVDYLETRIFLGSLLFGTPLRQAFDLAYTEDALRWWDPPTAIQVTTWKAEAARTLEEKLPGRSWENELSAIAKLPEGAEKTRRSEQARQRMREVLNPIAFEAAAPLRSDSSDTKMILGAQAKLEVIERLAKHWNDLLTGAKK